jgi:hypothetical protein
MNLQALKYSWTTEWIRIWSKIEVLIGWSILSICIVHGFACTATFSWNSNEMKMFPESFLDYTSSNEENSKQGDVKFWETSSAGGQKDFDPQSANCRQNGNCRLWQKLANWFYAILQLCVSIQGQAKLILYNKNLAGFQKWKFWPEIQSVQHSTFKYSTTYLMRGWWWLHTSSVIYYVKFIFYSTNCGYTYDRKGHWYNLQDNILPCGKFT